MIILQLLCSHNHSSMWRRAYVIPIDSRQKIRLVEYTSSWIACGSCRGNSQSSIRFVIIFNCACTLWHASEHVRLLFDVANIIIRTKQSPFEWINNNNLIVTWNAFENWTWTCCQWWCDVLVCPSLSIAAFVCQHLKWIFIPRSTASVAAT